MSKQATTLTEEQTAQIAAILDVDPDSIESIDIKFAPDPDELVAEALAAAGHEEDT